MEGMISKGGKRRRKAFELVKVISSLPGERDCPVNAVSLLQDLWFSLYQSLL